MKDRKCGAKFILKIEMKFLICCFVLLKRLIVWLGPCVCYVLQGSTEGWSPVPQPGGESSTVLLKWLWMRDFTHSNNAEYSRFQCHGVTDLLSTCLRLVRLRDRWSALKTMESRSGPVIKTGCKWWKLVLWWAEKTSLLFHRYKTYKQPECTASHCTKIRATLDTNTQSPLIKFICDIFIQQQCNLFQLCF